MFLVVILVPELFRKLRETPGMHSHLFSSKSEPGCPSYDKKTKKLTTKKQRLLTCERKGPKRSLEGPLRVLQGSSKGPLRVL